MPAGYSGKPLAEKLGIGPGCSVWLVHAPPGFEDLLGPLPPGARVARRAPRAVDVAHLFATRRRGLGEEVARLQEAIAPGGALWVSWPKRASGLDTDLTEDVLRHVILPTGWVDVKVCAVDDAWSGLKFLRRRRPSDKPGRLPLARPRAPSFRGA